MAGEMEIKLRADTGAPKPYWTATVTEDDSPMWDGSGPTPDMALYSLCETLMTELMEERARNAK